MIMSTLLLCFSSFSIIKGEGSSLNVRICDNIIEADGEIIISICIPSSNFTGDAHITVHLVNVDNLTVMRYSSVVQFKNGLGLLVLKPSELRAGLYNVYIILTMSGKSLKGTTVLGVMPDKKEIASLWTKVSRAQALLENIEGIPLYNEEVSKVQKEILDVIKILRRLSVETSYDITDIKDYTMVGKKLKSIEERAEYLYSSSFPQRLLKNFESTINFNSSMAIRFWSKLFSMSVWTFIFLLVLIPPLVSDFHVILANMRYLISNVEGESGIDDMMKEVVKRIEGLVMMLENYTNVGLKEYFLMIVSALLATIGLLTDNVITVIGSMLIAPLLMMTLSSGISMAFLNIPKYIDIEIIERVKEIFIKSFKNEILMVALSTFISYLTALITSRIIPLIPTHQIVIRSAPNLGDVAVAIIVGMISPIAFLKREYSMLTGIAIAIALIPPSATIGIGLAMLRTDITLGAMTLLLVNLVAIKITSYVFSKIYPLLPLITRLYRGIISKSEITLKGVLKSNTLTYLIAAIKVISILTITWIRLVLSLSPYEKLTLEILKRRLLKAIMSIVLIISPSLIALLISTETSKAFAFFFELFKEAYWSIYNFSKPIQSALSLMSFIFMIILAIRVHKIREYVIIMMGLGTIGCIIGLYAYPKSATIITLSIIGLIALLHSRNKAIGTFYALAIFAISITMVYSVRTYEKITTYAAYPHVENTCKNLISQLLGINSSDFEVIYYYEQNTLIVKIFVNGNGIERYPYKISPELLEVAKQALEEVLAMPKLKVRFEYVEVLGT